ISTSPPTVLQWVNSTSVRGEPARNVALRAFRTASRDRVVHSGYAGIPVCIDLLLGGGGSSRKNCHQRLSELRTDMGYQIDFVESRPAYGPSGGVRAASYYIFQVDGK